MEQGIMETDQKNIESPQYLTFQVAGQEYALAIKKVREIVEYGSLTKVPRTPAAIRGVTNLRGNVVPVIDLALLFGIGSGPITARTCIIVVETSWQGECSVMGVLADAVNKVAQWSNADVLPPPAFGTRVPVDFITGMVKSAQEFVIVLEIDKVLSRSELAASAALREL
jgi:purine-binding chemotaxis protein CheW